VAFVVFAGPLVPVLGPLATVTLAAGYLLVGAALWTGTTSFRRAYTDPRNAPGRSSARGVEPGR
jgi:hypothetical protein